MTALRQIPSCGRIIHYVTPAHGPWTWSRTHRPAVVILSWSPGSPDAVLQLQVFTDRLNDGLEEDTVWATSVSHDEDEKKPGTWHWPEHVAAVPPPPPMEVTGE